MILLLVIYFLKNGFLTIGDSMKFSYPLQSGRGLCEALNGACIVRANRPYLRASHSPLHLGQEIVRDSNP